MKDFCVVIGYFLNKEKFPCFATPLFIDDKNKMFVQEIKNGYLTFKPIKGNLKEFKNFIQISPTHFTIDSALTHKFYCFAFNSHCYKLGKKQEVKEFIENNFNKFRNKFKNLSDFSEIVEFVNSEKNKNDELVK